MRDFRIVHAKVLLKVFSLSPVRGMYPPAVQIVGEGMDKAQEVYFNGILCPEFVIQSPTRLIFRKPKSQEREDVQDVKVVTSSQVTRGDALLSYELSKPPRVLSGIERLVQSWTMIFLSTPGSDVFDKGSGGGALSLIGQVTDRSNSGVSADLAVAIERTKQELLRKQSSNRNLPPSEKLLSSDLQALQFDEKTSTLSAKIALRNMTGDEAEVAVG